MTLISNPSYTPPSSILTLEPNVSNLKMAGTASLGTSGNVPDSDHVHPRGIFTYYATLSANQTTGLTSGSPVLYNTLQSDASSNAPNITLSGGAFSLPTGFKYEFIVQNESGYSGSTGSVYNALYNNTASAYFTLPSMQTNQNPPSNTGNYDTNPTLIGEISNTSGSNISVQVNIKSPVALTVIQSLFSVLKIIATKI